ncbi:MAG: hypothetical protein KDK23_14735 [Leptospiraceae bacterium]|nr:hypothetical protein [Leptospiraceae bacterium]
MSIHDELKKAQSILESQRQVLAEPAVKKTVAPLEKALQKFIQAARPYEGIDWDGYLQLRNALKSAKITQTNLEEVNRRIKFSGLKFQAATKAAKQNLALMAAQKNQAAAIAEELSKSADTLKKEKIYSLARAENVSSAVVQLSDKELKDVLKFAGLKEKKQKKGNRTVFDRGATEASLIEHLKEVRFRIGN